MIFNIKKKLYVTTSNGQQHIDDVLSSSVDLVGRSSQGQFKHKINLNNNKKKFLNYIVRILIYDFVGKNIKVRYH